MLQLICTKDRRHQRHGMSDKIIDLKPRLRAKADELAALRWEVEAIQHCLSLLSDPIQEARESCTDEQVVKALRHAIEFLEVRADEVIE